MTRWPPLTGPDAANGRTPIVFFVLHTQTDVRPFMGPRAEEKSPIRGLWTSRRDLKKAQQALPRRLRRRDAGIFSVPSWLATLDLEWWPRSSAGQLLCDYWKSRGFSFTGFLSFLPLVFLSSLDGQPADRLVFLLTYFFRGYFDLATPFESSVVIVGLLGIKFSHV